MSRRNFYSDEQTDENIALAVKRTGASMSFLIRTCLNNYLPLVIPAARITPLEASITPIEEATPKIASYVPRRSNDIRRNDLPLQ